jgi:hypothetical protein
MSYERDQPDVNSFTDAASPDRTTLAARIANRFRHEFYERERQQLDGEPRADLVPVIVSSRGDFVGFYNLKIYNAPAFPNPAGAIEESDLGDVDTAESAIGIAFQDIIANGHTIPVGDESRAIGYYVGDFNTGSDEQPNMRPMYILVETPKSQFCLVVQNGVDGNGDPAYDIYALGDTGHTRTINDDAVVPENYRDPDLTYTAGTSGQYQIDPSGNIFLLVSDEAPVCP